ncbi:MAG: tryptophan 7-halogenase [Marinibacterium sp.]|nr:tryptophan 7-halogenase [Marinibacterium sp.]
MTQRHRLRHPEFDIALAGGGPAGSVAAILLARAGFRVGLATLPRQGTRIEGLSPRICSVLRANGLPLDGVAPATQRQVRWGASSGAQNVEHLVRRDVFDAGLLGQAAQDGVQIVTAAIATVDAPGGAIHLRDGTTLCAGLLFDARGRRAPRRTAADDAKWKGPDNVSVAGFVPTTDHAPDHAPGSIVEARPGGWSWRARLEDGRDWLQIVGDASALSGADRAQGRVAGLWHHVLGADAPALPDHPVVSDAGLRLNTPQLDPACPSLGDAAVALDPLSGHGMFWAISSALMAVPLARAILDGQTDLAQRFYHDRVIDTFWRQARVGRDFYAEGRQGGAFWDTRAMWPDSLPSHPVVDAPWIEPRVLCENGRLRQGEVLVTNLDPGGAGYVMGHDIAPLLCRLGGQCLPDLATFHSSIAPHLSPAEAEALHGWFTQRGLANTPAIHIQQETPSCDTRPAA